MTTYRCPKHDALFDANTPPSNNGHAKCPLCNPKVEGKPNKDGKVEPKLVQGED
jgi:Rieske Fe-S protein